MSKNSKDTELRAQISIVIPARDAEASLPDCLSALIEGVMAGLVRELILSDGGSRDRTALIADAAGAVVISGPGGSLPQVRRGVAAARAEWLLVLQADTVLAPGWSDAVAAHMALGPVPACFRLKPRARGLTPALAARWANLRTGLFGRACAEQGLLVPRRLCEAAAGRPDAAEMALAALLRAPRPRPVLLEAEAIRPLPRPAPEGGGRRAPGPGWTRAGGDPGARGTRGT